MSPMKEATVRTVPEVQTTTIAVAGSDARFPVRRVYCVGRNYAAHAREMGADPDRDPPFFFLKPADAVVPAEGELPYPPLTSDLHHEVELVVAIGRGGADIAERDAHAHVWGAAVAVDLTRRDLQADAKKAARPWEWGKSFDAAAPCGPLRPLPEPVDLSRGAIWLEVDGARRQHGSLDEMIWSAAEIIAFCSRASRLEPGDLILTGTPAGVGPLVPGNQIRAGIDGLGEIAFTVGLPTHGAAQRQA